MLDIQVHERVMYQAWCALCKKWLGGPCETRHDVPDHLISQHAAMHVDAIPEGRVF